MTHIIAETLLKSQALYLNTHEYFTWTSGIKSPIYCDNRKLISHPTARNIVIEGFLNRIQSINFDVIAGTATAGIPWASFLSDRLQCPMIYIRSQEKGHGLKNSIEGELKKNSNVLVIEDLISTGKSSIAAADKILEQSSNVVGIVSIFQYGFPLPDTKYPIQSLCTLDQLLETALELSFINANQKEEINQWKKSVTTT